MHQQGEKKGKVATKGTKQIVEENVATLKFYRAMSILSCSVFLIVILLVQSFTGTIITMTIITFLIHGASNYFMMLMSRPHLSETGAILDSGTDLNLEGGVSE